MDKNGYNSTRNQAKYIYHSNNSGNIKQERSPLPPKIKNYEDELELFAQKKIHERPGKIIHQSTEQSIDKQGNRVIKTKTVREIGTIEKRTKKFVEPKNSISNNSQAYNQDRSNKKYYRVSKYSRINEAEKQKALYSSPDFQGGSPYGSPIFMNDIKNSNEFDEVGYKTNFRYETKNVNGKNIGSYTQRERYEYINSTGNQQGYGSSEQGSPEVEIISPVGYAANYSSGSEFDESQMRSLDNYPTAIRNEYNFNRRIKKNKNLNYEMEDPEGFDYLRNNERNKDNIESKRMQYLNRSEYRNAIADDSYRSDKLDFQSPDRNMNVPNKFRNVNVGMIDSKGPTNDDGKVTKILTTKTESITRSKLYKNNAGKKPKNGTQNNLSKIDAARIIQAWWRRRYFGEEEIYNITVKKAIKLQSFIRGFLVRKKVLRYITLAIYYQSFCDKLQDVLCNNIKKEIFKYFKEKFLGKTSTSNLQSQPQPKPAQDNSSYNNRRTKIIPINKNMIDDVTRKEIIISKSKRVTQQQTLPQKRSIQTSKSTYTQTSSRPNQYTSSNLTPMSYPSPNIYSNRPLILHRSPDIYNHRTNYMPKLNRTPDYYQERNINYRINKSFDNIDYEENPRNVRLIPRGNRNYNYNYYNRVDNNEEKEKERYISPTFGSLRNNKNITTTKRIITTNRSNDNYNNIRRDGRRIMKSNTEQIYDNVNTHRKVIKTIVTSSQKKKIHTRGNRTKNITKNIKKIPIEKSPNQIISGGTLSIIKLPNRRMNNSESEDVYTRMKKKTVRKEVYTNKSKNTGFVPVNHEIDNQLSIGITKLRKEESEYNIRNKRVREEFITYKEPEKEEVKEIIKEKIIIQKEAKPETAEEGNDRQIFDMKIIKGLAMSIGASTETREIIKNEQKEIEIFKKREREKNKEIDKYKEDIQKEKLKNKHDNLRRAMKITEYWKKSILQKKFNQFKNNCFSGPKVYEIGTGIDFQLTHKPKQKKDFSTQFTTEKVDEGSQAVIKNEEDEKKKVKNFDVLKIQNNRPFSFGKTVKKKEKVENKITSTSKLKIISNIKKEDYGAQSEPWKTEITKVKSNINIKSTKPETVEEGAQYTREENKVGQTRQIEIIQSKPELVDTEIQHEYPDNYIDKKLVIEIKGNKPKYADSDTQYDQPQSKITKSQPLSIKGIPKKEVIKKVDKKDAQCNTYNETEEIGINAVVEEKPKPKNIEVKIRTVKRSLHSLEIPLLKKIWKRKAFRTFRDNCRRPEFHKILGRELLRMAFLRWRFVKGYGPDRYGNVYDRDGNLLYKTKGKVADMEVQQDFIVEKEEESTQYIPIENVISTLKQFEIGASYNKKKEPEKVDQGVGSDIRMAEVIQKGESVSYKYKKKERPKNKISKNDNIEFKKIEKKLKDEGTDMPVVPNKIIKQEKINISNDEYKLRNQKNSRIKELLIQMIYKKMMDDKLTLSDALRQWLKQTILSLQKESNELDKQKRRYASISKAERFALIEEIKKIESGTQMEVKKNEVVKMPNINVIRIKKMKDSGVGADIPFVFDIEKIKPQNENKLLYKSSKKPLVLETHKENEMNIYSEDYIFREEVKKGIHHPITEEGKTRISEILYRFFETRGSPISALRKYFTIWYRKAKYLACIDNARIISDFCKRNLTRALNYKKWKKICEKLILREKIKIIKMTPVADQKRNKLFDLIRLTRINTVYAKRRYLHYILLCWLIYTRNINRKRKHIKALYENMLSTYMHMADDVFGNNQKENPSVQDALFEAVDSDKFHYKQIKDVPIAEEYYKTKKQIQKVTTNITYVNNNNNININDNRDDDDIDEKEYITYKTFVSKHPIPAPSSSKREVKVIEKVGRVAKVGEGEKLHSRGRGRKYRTKNEKEILNKFYSENRNYSKSKERLQKEESEENANEKDSNNFGEKKSVRITIKKTGGKNRSFNKEEMRKIYKIENSNGNIDIDNLDNDNIDDDDNNNIDNNNVKKTEMTYSQRRKYFGKRFNDEDEKEEEDEN